MIDGNFESHPERCYNDYGKYKTDSLKITVINMGIMLLILFFDKVF